jgi:hypothetical protein
LAGVENFSRIRQAIAAPEAVHGLFHPRTKAFIIEALNDRE